MITSRPLHKIGSDQRGATYIFDNDRTGEFIVIYRFAGSVSGSEYHQGKAAYKSPEKLVILSGSVRVDYSCMATKQIGQLEVAAPAEIIIPVNMWHRVEAITDAVMLECNSMSDCKIDTMKVFEQPFLENLA